MVWAPQPGPQKALIDCPIPEVLFGGARGGGKTDGILGKFVLKGERYGKRFNAIFFRKEMPQQDDLVERAKEIYLPIGSTWLEQKKQFILPGGGRIRFRPLENTADAAKYQGQNITDAAVEEAGNYETSGAIDRLFGCLRSVGGVPIQLTLTANPGGPGHGWLKHRYVDPAPLGMRVLERALPNGAKHRYCYIPSRVQNNRALLESDPEYINRLYLVGSPELVRAWLEGDWNVILGAYFPEFTIDRHVIAPRELPKDWTRFRAMDWGSYRPSAVIWFAVSDGTLPQFPANALVAYREVYTASEPNVGLKLTAEEMADRIIDAERGDKINYGVLDPAAWKQEGGPSIAERMTRRKVFFQPADNARLVGWDQVRARLKGEDDRPMLYVFSTCTNLIRTLPALQHDENKPEDVDTDGEDHLGDALRYGCMSRPYKQPEAQPKPKSDGYHFSHSGGFTSNLTWREMIERRERAARNA